MLLKLVVALWLGAVLCVALFVPVVASESEGSLGGSVRLCRDRDELAGILKAEGNAEPYAGLVAMGQIIVADVETPRSNHYGLTICALARLTNFISVRRYAQRHPGSWTAWAIEHPDEIHYMAADDALLHRTPPLLPGYYHFDGSSHGELDEVRIGSLVFRH